MTDEELVGLYLDDLQLRRQRRAGTIAAYRKHLRHLVAWLAEDGKTLASATVADLALWVSRELQRQGLRPRSRRVPTAAVRGFYRWAHEFRHLPNDTARRLEYPRVAAALPYALTEDDVAAMLQHVDLSTLIGVRDAAMLLMLSATGCRVSGLVGLDQEDIAFDRVRLAAVVRLREKASPEREVPLHQDAVVALQAYIGHPELDTIERRTPHGTVLFVTTSPGDATPADEFVGERRRLSTNGVRRRLLRYAERAGVARKVAHPHAFRHMVGISLAEAGVDLDVRAQLLGHASAESVRIYDRMSRRRLREAVELGSPLNRVASPFRELAQAIRRRESGRNGS